MVQRAVRRHGAHATGRGAVAVLNFLGAEAVRGISDGGCVGRGVTDRGGADRWHRARRTGTIGVRDGMATAGRMTTGRCLRIDGN